MSWNNKEEKEEIICGIRGSHSGVTEDWALMGCETF
jgi:hypothetical protein